MVADLVDGVDAVPKWPQKLIPMRKTASTGGVNPPWTRPHHPHPETTVDASTGRPREAWTVKTALGKPKTGSAGGRPRDPHLITAAPPTKSKGSAASSARACRPS